MQNIKHGRQEPLTSFRKIAISYWKHPTDPSTYSSLDLSMEPAQAFMDGSTGERPVTVTHFVAKILGHCFEKYPHLNLVLLRNNLYKRNDVNIFITTLLKRKGGTDLSGFMIPDINGMSLSQVAAMSFQKTEALRQDNDPEILKLQRRIDRVPPLLLKPFFAFADFFQYTLNRTSRWLGIPEDRFGSAIISNVGALGIDNAYIPLSPYSRCPLIIGIGKPREVPIVRKGEVAVDTKISISFTADHRYADGFQGAQMLRRFQKVFESPERFPSVFEGGASGALHQSNNVS